MDQGLVVATSREKFARASLESNFSILYGFLRVLSLSRAIVIVKNRSGIAMLTFINLISSQTSVKRSVQMQRKD